jgi:signal peptidase I
VSDSADEQKEPTTEPPRVRNPQGRLRKKGEPEETPLEALVSLLRVAVMALFAYAFIGQQFMIPSGSMENTLLIGDHLLVDRSTLMPPTKWAPFVHHRPVERGDVVVFLKPNPESPDLVLVKRVIGVAGDRIHMVHGIVYLNGVAQDEPYQIPPLDNVDSPRAYVPYRDDFPADVPAMAEAATANKAPLWAADLPNHIVNGEIVVPPGKLFAMGDNRTDSADGRFWGFIPEENILGRPLFVYWSFKTPEDQEDKTSAGDQVAYIFHVVLHFFDGTRWSRMLHVIR